MAETHAKVKVTHLNRDAYLYVRQSTVRQVFENTESTKRQYALKQRAIALGWPLERVQVIDTDLGQSGASAGGSRRFQALDH
jgi:DNA invertase Pin-like site-specific DNA recombinase